MAITADKKKRRLLLLTRRFPFNRGEVAAESYLENEIGVLSTYFDEVLAVGTEAQPGDAPTCALPGNVTPLALGCGNTSKDKALLAVKGIAFPLLGGADVREAYATESVHGIGKRVFRGYFAARAKAKADVLAEELVRFGFEPTHIQLLPLRHRFGRCLADRHVPMCTRRCACTWVRSVCRSYRCALFALPGIPPIQAFRSASLLERRGGIHKRELAGP